MSTSAGSSGLRSQRAPSVRSVDIHAHWYPREWLKLFERDAVREGARLERSAAGYRIATERLSNLFDDTFVEIEPRVAAMDRTRVDVQALSLTSPMVYWASAGLGEALSQCFNDAAAAAHARCPTRFVGLAMLPMQEPQRALKELE